MDSLPDITRMVTSQSTAIMFFLCVHELRRWWSTIIMCYYGSRAIWSAHYNVCTVCVVGYMVIWTVKIRTISQWRSLLEKLHKKLRVTKYPRFLRVKYTQKLSLTLLPKVLYANRNFLTLLHVRLHNYNQQMT
jgi:hypothetical protein